MGQALPCRRAGGTSGRRCVAVKKFVQMISPDNLSPFEQHPFQVREDESLEAIPIKIYFASVTSASQEIRA